LIRAILLDAVGTLIGLRAPLGETYARIARRHGLTLAPWRIEDAFRRASARMPPPVFPAAAAAEVAALERSWWRGLVRSTFLAADSEKRFSDFDAFFDELWARYAKASAWQARPGARGLLGALRARGVRTAVVSNFDGRLPSILEGLGLLPLLDAVVLPSEAGAAKPDPRIFAAALARLGVAAHEALFVGDDLLRDLEGARRAGLTAVDVASLATLDELPARLEAASGQRITRHEVP